jgi:hypothetical protein
MSMTLTDGDVAAVVTLLSTERLATLVTLTGSQRSAIEIHQQTLALNAGLMNVIASVEIALRNTVCDNLNIFFGTNDWLTRPPTPFQWRKTENQNVQKALESARRSSYAKLSQAEKAALDIRAFPNGRPLGTSHIQRATQRRRQITVSNGKVIAETTLYFWKRIFSADYEQALWRTTLKRIFPNKKITRAQVAQHLEYIYQARNRIAHHEPVLHKRFEEAVMGVDFVAKNIGSSVVSADTPLARLIATPLSEVKLEAQQLHERLDSFRGP